MYIRYEAVATFPPDDTNSVTISTSHNLGAAPSSVVDAVKAIDGITGASLCRGTRPGTDVASEMENAITVRKDAGRAWEGDLLPRVEETVVGTMFPPGPPPPPGALH